MFDSEPDKRRDRTVDVTHVVDKVPKLGKQQIQFLHIQQGLPCFRRILTCTLKPLPVDPSLNVFWKPPPL